MDRRDALAGGGYRMINMKDEYIAEFAKTMKVGLVATVDENNDPHITILSTIMAKSHKQMMFGEFVTGMSKQQIEKNNNAGFLIMNLKKEFWTGCMKWTSKTTEGEDFIMYNMQPKYRYNTYFGIHTVHYADLIDLSEKRTLSMGAIILNALKVMMKKGGMKGDNDKTILKPWAFELMKKMDTLKFISYIDEEGFPRIIPIIQAQAVSTNRIVLSDKPYNDELMKIKAGSRVAIFGLNLSMENVLIKGVFSGFDKEMATMDIHRVYNSMPPKMGYIYPPVKNEAVSFN